MPPARVSGCDSEADARDDWSSEGPGLDDKLCVPTGSHGGEELCYTGFFEILTLHENEETTIYVVSVHI